MPAGDRRATAHADAEPKPEDGPEDRAEDRPVSVTKIALGAIALLGLIGVYWGLSESGALAMLTDQGRLRGMVEGLGVWGPVALIGLMVAAIVLSPIPSGPIALAAGAAYGPLWGTVYVVIGAEAGAVIAFWVARCLGYETVRRWPAVRPLLDRLGQSRSQLWLMVAVFASRLVPFISFDAASYAAGLTPLAFWRFALATLAGVIPISFVLAYFGEGLIETEMGSTTLLVAVLGGVTLLPLGAKMLWNWRRRHGKRGHQMSERHGSAHSAQRSSRQDQP